MYVNMWLGDLFMRNDCSDFYQGVLNSEHPSKEEEGRVRYQSAGIPEPPLMMTPPEKIIASNQPSIDRGYVYSLPPTPSTSFSTTSELDFSSKVHIIIVVHCWLA